jgi:PAT family beta-lactamase induction signal transducer AmpG
VPNPDAQQAPSERAATGQRRPLSPHLWVSSTYFAEGYPYTIVNNLAEFLFKALGASYGTIGLTSLFHLPWNLKFLWGPFLDRFETKRRWLWTTEVLLTLVTLALAFVAPAAELLGVIAALFMVMAVLSATHDIAIDGYYLEGLDERGQSRFVGYRAMAYKIASLIVRGPLVIMIGLVGWAAGLFAAAGLMALLAVGHALLLPRVERRQHRLRELLRAMLRFRVLAVGAVLALLVVAQRQLGLFSPLGRGLRRATLAVPGLAKISVAGWIGIGLFSSLLLLLALRKRIQRRITGRDSYYTRAFVDFLAQPQVGRILAFVVLFRTGESLLLKMKWPFLNDRMAVTLEQYGFVNGTLGVVASFVATFAGGYLISRHGLRRWIWPFVLGQNLLNLLYVALALWGVPAPAGLWAITAVITAEHFGEGLGTAVFMVYLMRCCDPNHKAAHMAILTALMSVSFTFAGVFSGFMAEAIGFAPYFALSFAATLPAMVLVFFIPHLDEREGAASRVVAGG